LKAPFARPRQFYENLKERHLPKIRTVGAATPPRPDALPQRLASMCARTE